MPSHKIDWLILIFPVDSNLLLRLRENPARELVTAELRSLPFAAQAESVTAWGTGQGTQGAGKRIIILAEKLIWESLLFFVAENLTFAVDLVAVKEVSVEMLVVVIQ